MKQFNLRQILLAIACLFVFTTHAEILNFFPDSIDSYDSGSSSSKPRKNVVILVTPRNVSKRPKADYSQQIYCEYDNGNLYVSFAEPEGTCALLLTEYDTGFTYRYVFDTEEDAVIYVGEISSAYLLFETSRGYFYEGRMD